MIACKCNHCRTAEAGYQGQRLRPKDSSRSQRCAGTAWAKPTQEIASPMVTNPAGSKARGDGGRKEADRGFEKMESNPRAFMR